MKRLLFLSFMLMSVASTFAQSKYFKLTPAGFVNNTDTTKDYVVIEVPNKTQTELYQASLIYFTSLYVSPQDVISKVENEVITINGYKAGAVHENGFATPFNINYTIVLKYKDGKIKVESPSFRLAVGLRRKFLVYSGFSMDGTESGIFNKKGKIKSERALNDLEAFFQDFIIKYQEGIKTDKKDW